MSKTKSTFIISLLFLSLVPTLNCLAQSVGSAVAKKAGVYVFPANKQDQNQQEKDESYCYTWAVQQSGYDPINPTVVQAQQVQQGPDGSAFRGSARGALGGAAIGAISGNAGRGAAIGAIGGALLGHRRGRMRHSMEQSAANEQANQQNLNLVDGFRKAFSVCLEGKGYTVK